MTMDTTTTMLFKLAQAPVVNGMSEYLGAQFICDKPFILREPNDDYIKRELEWYDSQSLYVDDIPGDTPKIWQDVSSKHGRINSNYGWCVYSPANGNQFNSVVNELRRDSHSRRAVMYYTNPSMHTQATDDGMNDHMCTTHVQYFIRDKRLCTYVYMRSNDAVFGYNNDYAWQSRVASRLADALEIKRINPIVWNVGSLHVYPRHQDLLETYR